MLGSETEKIFLFLHHGFVSSPPRHRKFGAVRVPEFLTFPRRCCSTGGLQRDSAVCGNTQVLLSGGDPVRINTSPYQLFPSHYNWESYLLPNCPSSAGLRLESLIAALF